MKDTLDSLDGELEDKAVGYAQVMKEFDGQIAIIKAEIDRLKERMDRLNHNKDLMKTALKEAMELAGKEKFKTELFSFNIQNNPATVEIDLNAEIPEKFYIEQDPKLDKKKLIKAVKGGEEFKGVKLVQGRTLRIR